MREIKFRGKRIDSGEWVYGYFTKNKTNGNCYITTQSLAGGAHPHRVDPETVGEFTGLKDKNGVEIYEGDVIYLKHETGYETWDEEKEVVKFELGSFSCDIYADPGGVCDCEVVGNIHENQELMGWRLNE